MIETRILSQFDREIKQDFAPTLNIDLNPREVELILLAYKFPGAPMGYYGRAIGMEKGSFTYLCELLIEKDLIVRQENPKDSRSKLLILTDQGNSIAEIIRKQLDLYLFNRLKVFTEYELCQLQYAIDTIKHLSRQFHERNLEYNKK